MPAIADVAAELTAAPKPVLCLDTCDILEVVQCLPYDKLAAPRAVGCIEPVRRLLGVLAANPDRVRLVVTQLVAHEWGQNIHAIRTSAERHLSHVDDAVARICRAAALAGNPLASPPALAGGALVADLEDLSRALLNQAEQLDLGDDIVLRAIDRVRRKARPSHDGHV